jgi:acetyl esterase/lipase
LPSIQSKLFNMFADRQMKAMFNDFDIDRNRKVLATMDRVFPDPPDVDVEAVALNHCEADWLRPHQDTDRVVLYFPGGGWVLRSPRLHRRIAGRIANAAHANVLLVFYRLAPEHPFPAGLEDCLEAYASLLAQGIDSSRIVIGGDSAGGNLALATLLALRDQGQPGPAGAILLSACTDMSLKEGGANLQAHDIDTFMPEPPDSPDKDPRLLYAGGDEDVLDHPYASPIRGNLDGLCPLLLQVGGNEWLLNQTTLFGERAREAGVSAEVEVWEDQPHVWHSMPLPESAQAFLHLGDFIRYCCP